MKASDRMRQDWDERAKRDARFYIASGTAEEDSFWRSGEQELDDLVLSDVRLSNDASVVEIGCGIGRLLLPLARRVGSVTGVDISAIMVEKAAAACADAPNVRVHVTDGSLKAVPDGSQDFVFSYIVFQHIPELAPIAAYLMEAARVLRPGGVFHFQVDGRVRRRGSYQPGTYEGITVSGEEVAALLLRTGLSAVEQWGRDTHYFWTTARKDGDDPRVAIVERVLDERELADFSDRLSKATGGAAPALTDVSLLRRALDPFLEMEAPKPPEAFVRDAFRVLLARDPLPDELDFNRGILERGLERPHDWIDTLATSRELRARLRPVVPVLDPMAEETLRKRLARSGARDVDAAAPMRDVLMALSNRLKSLPVEDAVNQAYRIVLDRDAEADGLRYFVEKLTLGHFTFVTLLTELMLSEELRSGASL